MVKCKKTSPHLDTYLILVHYCIISNQKDTIMQASLNRKNGTVGAQPDYSKAFPEIFRILDRWGCSQEEQCLLLAIDSRTTLNKYRKGDYPAKLGRDLLERMSYILNINKSLKIIFTSAESVDGWVRKPNKHPLFDGSSAMSKMLNGNMADLYVVAKYTNAMRG